jgi:hypothetical protein
MRSTDSLMPATSFESFLQGFNIPNTCKLDKPIFKKMLLDTDVLGATDKKVLKEDVDKIRWLYTLKPNTINISPYKDEEREYPEIAILHIEVSEVKRQNRIVNFFNKAIPYPLVLFFTYKNDDKEQLSISLAEKRINQADNDKWVLEQAMHTEWIRLSEENDQKNQVAFINNFKCDNLPFTNFWDFYQALMAKVIALQCAEHTGSFDLKTNDINESHENRRQKLLSLASLEEELKKIRTQLKKGAQMNEKMSLNVAASNIKKTIATIKELL